MTIGDQFRRLTILINFNIDTRQPINRQLKAIRPRKDNAVIRCMQPIKKCFMNAQTLPLRSQWVVFLEWYDLGETHFQQYSLAHKLPYV